MFLTFNCNYLGRIEPPDDYRPTSLPHSGCRRLINCLDGSSLRRTNITAERAFLDTCCLAASSSRGSASRLTTTSESCYWSGSRERTSITAPWKPTTILESSYTGYTSTQLLPGRLFQHRELAVSAGICRTTAPGPTDIDTTSTKAADHCRTRREPMVPTVSLKKPSD